jgi:hypothetical protein
VRSQLAASGGAARRPGSGAGEVGAWEGIDMAKPKTVCCGAAVSLGDVRSGLRGIRGVLKALSEYDANVGLDDDPVEVGAVRDAFIDAARDGVDLLLKNSA